MNPKHLTANSHKKQLANIDGLALSPNELDSPRSATGSSDGAQSSNGVYDSRERSASTCHSSQVECLPTSPCLHSVDNLASCDSQARECLYRWFTSDELADLQLKWGSQLQAFWEALPEPPITQQSLSELDIPRIIQNAQLRHDLNFEPEVSFRPNHHGPQGQKKLRDAEIYWEALAIELATYFGRQKRNRHRHIQASSQWQPEPARTSERLPWRLPQMFKTLREVLKTLVPAADWSLVDQTLDVGLLIQQLDKGVCDLIGLSEWLGELLRRSCSPMRDDTVLYVIKLTQEASLAGNARELVFGINNLFGVLETMKLDVANHQIRHLRLLMADDSVHFEQKYFLRKIADQEDYSAALKWFRCRNSEELETCISDEARLKTFSRSVLAIVTSTPNTPIATIAPKTFTFDMDRLQALRIKYQGCVYQDFYIEALLRNLHSLGYSGTPPLSVCNDLLVRIINLASPQRTIDGCYAELARAALEIVRRAYELCNRTDLLEEETVQNTITFIQRAQNAKSAIRQDLDNHLSHTLQMLVDHELETIFNLSPLQILNHYAHQRFSTDLYESQEALRHIANQIAHITVLHWRIWSPILYLQIRKDCNEESSAEKSPLNTIESSPKSSLKKGSSGEVEPHAIVSTHTDTGPSNCDANSASTSEDESYGQVLSDVAKRHQTLKGCAAVGFFQKLYG